MDMGMTVVVIMIMLVMVMVVMLVRHLSQSLSGCSVDRSELQHV